MKTEMDGCKRRATGIATVVGLMLLTSCASTPVTLVTVGPKPPVVHSTSGTGQLIVYSDTEAKRLDKGLPYYVHTSYVITAHDRNFFKWVPNHAGDMDQMPQSVLLPSGYYEIVAGSGDYGRVHVPVVIEAGRTTEVHLEGKGMWKPGGPSAADADWVRLPDGEIVGWSALAASGPKGSNSPR